MAASGSKEPDTAGEPAEDVSSKIAPWARGNHLRYVEKEVLIPKIVRERAKAKCEDLVKGIEETDRTYDLFIISLLFSHSHFS